MSSWLDWVLSHWAYFTVHRFICLFVCFCFILHSCIIVSTVGWTYGIEAKSLGRIFLQCFDTVGGSLTCKNSSLIWPGYNVFGGTLNLTQSINMEEINAWFTTKSPVTCDQWLPSDQCWYRVWEYLPFKTVLTTFPALHHQPSVDICSGIISGKVLRCLSRYPDIVRTLKTRHCK